MAISMEKYAMVTVLSLPYQRAAKILEGCPLQS
jgi:hypothetical protein